MPQSRAEAIGVLARWGAALALLDRVSLSGVGLPERAVNLVERVRASAR
jgi:hypothetical protein